MYLVFDIGGTHIRLATSLDGENLEAEETIPTSLNFEESMDHFSQAAQKLLNGKQLTAVAGGARALDKTKTHLVPQPHYPMWVNDPLHQKLEEILGVPVLLENDAAMAGLGEATHGPGKGHKIVAYHTISTGIGGGRVVNGVIDPNSMGFEPGNQIIDADGSLLNQTEPVYWEGYVGGDALQIRFNKPPEEEKDEKVWDEVAKIIAIGLNNTLVYWSPDIVILGGSVMKSVSLDKVKSYLREVVKIYPELPPVVEATLGDTSGLYGALQYLKKRNSSL